MPWLICEKQRFWQACVSCAISPAPILFARISGRGRGHQPNNPRGGGGGGEGGNRGNFGTGVQASI